MTDPIHAEKLFRNLHRELQEHPSIRHRYTLIREFLSQLEGEYARFESYLVQLAEQLPVYSGPVSYSGLDPELIEGDLRQFREIEDEMDEIGESANYRNALEKLEIVCLTQYICIGELEKAGQLFLEWFGINPFEGLRIEEGFNSKALQKVRDHLKSYSGHGDPLTHEARPCIRSVSDQTARRLESDDQTVCIPTVEEYRDADGTSRMYGRQRNLTVRVEGSEEGGEDKIIRRFPVIGAEQSVWLGNQPVTSAARQLLSSYEKRLQGKAFRGDILFETSSAFHDGTSVNAAMAFLWFTGIQAHLDLRQKYELQPGVCITGDIDEHGTIMPVAAEGIECKTEAAFYSGSDYLIVPASQLSLFREALERLGKKYRNRNLVILGVDNLRDLLYDRRVTTFRNPSKLTFSLQQAWELKFETAGVIIILILMTVIFRLVYGPLDPNPILGTFSENKLHLFNNDQIKVFSKNVGSGRLVYQENNRSDRSESQVQFYDLNKDGINEVFWYQVPYEGISEDHKLVAWSVTGDSLIWETPLIFEINYPNRENVLGSTFRLREFHIEHNKQGKPKIIANTNMLTYFPSIILSMDIENGEKDGMYVHPGYLYDIMLHDITGDGVPEILATGVSNAFWKSVISVLEMDHLQGQAPTTDEYFAEGFQTAEQLRYILVPKTIVGSNYDSVSKFNSGRRIESDLSESLLVFYIDDANSPVFNEASQPHIIIKMDKQLEPMAIGTNNRYDILARQLYNEEKIPFMPDDEYFEAFKDSLEYMTSE